VRQGFAHLRATWAMGPATLKGRIQRDLDADPAAKGREIGLGHGIRALPNDLQSARPIDMDDGNDSLLIPRRPRLVSRG